MDSPALSAKVEEAVAAFIFLGGRKPARIFMCDTIDPATGEHSYGSVWGFDHSSRLAMEARSVTGRLDVDVSPYGGCVHYLGIEYEDIILPEGVGADSRLAVEFKTAYVAYSSLSATGQNCANLLSVVADLLRPNLAASR